MKNTDSNIQTGDIAFFDNYIPSLEDGTYTIKATTAIKDIDTQDYFKNPVTRKFEVRGPQFTLPVSEVHSVYPPINSNSIFDQYLPNIVFNKRALPWERDLNKSDKSVPWLCLLIFAEGEITVDPKTKSALITSTAQEFLESDDNVLKPDIPTDSVPADVLATNCSHIRISAEVFNALAPKVAELKYLSHVRQVDTGDQAIMGVEDTGWFSVITGNRFLKSAAKTGTRFYVHLVSLEGYFDIMNGTKTWPKKKSDSSQDKDIALASLYNWTFLSQPEKLYFKELVENFSTQAKGNADNLLLRRYVTSPKSPDATTQLTLTRIQNGYIPLNYETMTGEKTFSWYRGPLSPVIAQPLPRSENYHFPSASSMIIYDNIAGIFDQSYSAAWSIGRALGLADGEFSQKLLKYRKKAYNIIGKMMDYLESANEATSSDLAEIIQSSVVLDTYKNYIKDNIGSSLSKVLKLQSSGIVNSHADLTNLNASASTSEKTDSFLSVVSVALKKSAKRMYEGEGSTKVSGDANTEQMEVASTTSPVDLAKSFFAEPAIQELLKTEVTEELTPIAQWLARQQLLYDIPFNYLVPDQLSLPVESLRFFYIDQNWLDSLTDGAISVGVQSSKDSFFNNVMRGVLNDAVTAEIKVIRDKLLGKSTSDTEPDSKKEALSGILIRSAVISGWPGLVVKGFKGDYETGTQLKTLRMDKLSSNVLFCVFLDIPDTVILAEPQQGLCFGAEDGSIIKLRQLTNPPGKSLGKNFPSSGGLETFFRTTSSDVGNDVLNINDGTNSVVQTMEESQYLNTTIGPAQFALQMVKAPEELSFVK